MSQTDLIPTQERGQGWQNENLLENGQQGIFEQLLESYEYERPKRGQVLSGQVVVSDENMVIVDVGLKRDAIVPRSDLDRLDHELREQISEGDLVNVYVTQPFTEDGKLIVSIQKGLTYADWARAEELLESGEPVEVEVSERNRGGLLAKFGSLRGFIPKSHLLRPGRRPENQPNHGNFDTLLPDLIGETLTVKVIEIDRSRNRLILSERALQRDRRKELLESLEPEQIVQGRIVRLVDFGAFVDLGGVTGLIHISELDWDWVSNPADIVQEGQELDVMVKRVDREKGRVDLSRKRLFPKEMVGEAVRVTYSGEAE